MSNVVAEREAFFARHSSQPDLNQFFSEFLATFSTCNPGVEATYEEMFEHIFGDGNRRGCEWCEKHYAWQKRYAKSFL